MESGLQGEGADERNEAHYSRFTSKEETQCHDFKRAILNELRGLLDDWTFEQVNLRTIPESTKIFNSRFIDEPKKAGKGLRLKSCLIAQNYFDEVAA